MIAADLASWLENVIKAENHLGIILLKNVTDSSMLGGRKASVGYDI